MDELSELDLLVDAYNTNEENQRQRLARIYEILRGRKGYREVRFGISDVWNNCWELDPRLAQQALVDKIIHKITSVNSGG